MTPRSPTDPYVSGLAMLARRELSVAQVRERLFRKGFTENQVETAVQRLSEEGAVDDRRTAAAYARQAAEVRMRGRGRTLRELGRLGIGRAEAREAVDEVYREVDEATLLGRTLSRRLEGRIDTRAQFRRLYHALLRQGFESSAVVAALMARVEPGVRLDD